MPAPPGHACVACGAGVNIPSEACVQVCTRITSITYTLCTQCPHHEAPNAVNTVLIGWIQAVEERLAALASGSSTAAAGGGAAAAAGSSTAAAGSSGSSAGSSGGGSGVGGGSDEEDPLLVPGPLAVGESLRVAEARGGEVVITHVEGQPRNVFERADAAVFALQRRIVGALRGA